MQTLENCVTDIYCCRLIYVCIFHFAWRKGGQSCTLKYMHMLEFIQTENVLSCFGVFFFSDKNDTDIFLKGNYSSGKI